MAEATCSLYTKGREGGSNKFDTSENVIKCFLCAEHFNVVDNKDDFLAHLIKHHKLVIGEQHMIANFPRYVKYWGERFSLRPDLKEFCSVIETNTKSTDKGEVEEYYLLCDVLPEDRLLREKMQKEKLIEVLAVQQKEREYNGFSKGCLFCKRQFLGNRSDVLDHMAKSHGFSVGLPDNLVYVGELLDLLQQKFNEFRCFYCDKIFKDRNVLKDHMRKKQHRSLNPRNTEYDKYYLINYLEFGKSWKKVQGEDDGEDVDVGSDSESDMMSAGGVSGSDTDLMSSDVSSEHNVAEEGSKATCLFCSLTVPTTRVNTLTLHMKETHSFDLVATMRGSDGVALTFYDRVKLINYIRHRVGECVCVTCEVRCDDRAQLLRHMSCDGHSMITGQHRHLWNHPEYYFPMLDNDGLLCSLDTLCGEGSEGVERSSEDTGRSCEGVERRSCEGVERRSCEGVERSCEGVERRSCDGGDADGVVVPEDISAQVKESVLLTDTTLLQQLQLQ